MTSKNSKINDEKQSSDVFIVNNIFDESEILPGWGRAIGSHSGTVGYYHDRIIIQGNIIKNTLRQAIRTYGFRNCQIEGNIIENCGGGITVESISDEGQSAYITNFVVSNNNIRTGGSYSAAISLTGRRNGKAYEIIVDDNIISNWDAIGIYCTYAEKVTVTNNSLSGIKQTGISSSNCVHLNNMLERVQGNGITCFDYSSFVVITSNLLKRVEGYGLLLSNNLSGVTIGNNLLAWVGNDQIRLTTQVKEFVINGNTILDNPSQGYDSQYGIFVTSTCSNGVITGNMAKGTTILNQGSSTIEGNNIA